MCVYIHLYICACMCMYVCMYIYIYICPSSSLVGLLPCFREAGLCNSRHNLSMGFEKGAP